MLRPRWLRWTIGYELTLLVLATLLPFAVLGLYWAGQDYRGEQQRIQARGLRLAHTVSDEVDQFVADTAALMEALARVPSVKRGEEPQVSQLFAELVQRYPYYESIFLASSEGRVLASGGADLPPPGNRQAYIQETLRSASTWITDPIEPRGVRNTGRHVFVVATPVWDENGKPLGIVAASVNLLRLQEALRRAELPDNSSVLIVDRAGKVVARRTDPEAWVGKSALSSSVVREALRVRDGLSEGSSIDGVRRLSAFSDADRVPWVVIVGIPTDEAYGALERELLRAVGRLALVGLIAGGVAWLFSRRLTSQIRRLVRAAAAYGAGDLTSRVRPGGPRELATLGTTLNEMAAVIERQVDELRLARQREREAGRHALDELRRLHSEFIAVAAHELRTPVAAAKNYAELLLRDDVPLDAAMRRQALARLDAVCDRLAKLVRSLLGASRIQAGRLEVHVEPVDLAALTARVCRDLAASTVGHEIRVHVPGTDRYSGASDSADGSTLVLGDAERIEDVLVNLISNAAKYSPAGSAVDVYVGAPGEADGADGMGEVRVTDRGPGIPVDEQAAVFERFRRGRGVGASGVGLGLYIAQAYVQAMGGQIGVCSQPGEGATFWFRLTQVDPDGAGQLFPFAASPTSAGESSGASAEPQERDAAGASEPMEAPLR